VRFARRSRRLTPPTVPYPADTAGERCALSALLASFGVGPDQHDKLLEELLAGARHRHRGEPHRAFRDCAVAYAEERFETWLATVLEPELDCDQAALPVGRAAYLACGGPTTWPHLLLVHHDLPDTFVAAMRRAAPPLSPVPAPAAMSEQALESWSLVDSARAALQLIGTALAQTVSVRPLAMASVRLTKRWP